MRIADAADDRLAVRARAGAVEGVRLLAAAFEHAEDFGAARLGVFEAFEHQRAGAFRHHEAVAVLGERLRRRLRRIVGWSTAPTAARSGSAIPGSPSRRCRCRARRRSRRAGSPRRRAGSRSRRRRRRSTARSASPWCRNARPDDRPPSRTGSAREWREMPGPRRAQQVVVADVAVGARLRGDRFARAAIRFRPAHREEQRTGKIALAADAGLRDRLLGGDSAKRSLSVIEQNGSTGTKSTVPAIVCAARRSEKRVMRRMPEWPAVSSAQLSVVADAERGDDADAGDGDDGRACCLCGDAMPLSFSRTASTSARPSPRQWPTLVTTTCCSGPAWSVRGRTSIGGGNSLPCSSASVASAMFMTNCGSNPCPR